MTYRVVLKTLPKTPEELRSMPEASLKKPEEVVRAEDGGGVVTAPPGQDPCLVSHGTEPVHEFDGTGEGFGDIGMFDLDLIRTVGDGLLDLLLALRHPVLFQPAISFVQVHLVVDALEHLPRRTAADEFLDDAVGEPDVIDAGAHERAVHVETDGFDAGVKGHVCRTRR